MQGSYLDLYKSLNPERYNKLNQVRAVRGVA